MMKNSRIPVAAGIILLLMIAFGSCEKVVFQPPELPDTISFSLEIQPIFNENCVNCHGGDRDPDLREGLSYEALTGGGFVDTADAEGSKLVKKLYGTHSSRASEAQKQLIIEWIRAGAKDN